MIDLKTDVTTRTTTKRSFYAKITADQLRAAFNLPAAAIFTVRGYYDNEVRIDRDHDTEHIDVTWEETETK